VGHVILVQPFQTLVLYSSTLRVTLTVLVFDYLGQIKVNSVIYP